MPNNELRDKMQAEAVRSVLDDRRVIVEWGTGVGKSRVAIRAISELMRAGKHKILLLVAESAHKNNWRREFVDMLGDTAGEDVYGSVTVECYASLPKYESTQWDLIVADEAHHLRSDNRTDIISTMGADYVLCLSATMSDGHDADALLDTLKRTFGPFRRFNFTVADAIEHSVLAEPKIYVHILDLESADPVKVEVAWGWPNARKEFECGIEQYRMMIASPSRFPNVKATVSCTAKEGYDILTYHHKAWKKRFNTINSSLSGGNLDAEQRANAERQLPYAKNYMLRYALLRKQLIGNCKTGYAVRLLDSLRDKKYICFCSTIEQGTALNAENIINSKRRDNAKVIDAFNSGDISSLFAVGMIQEGANLAGIQAGVIIQLDGKERPFVQKFGRTLRSSSPEQHILLVNNTQDVKYFRNIVTDIDERYIIGVDSSTGELVNLQLDARASGRDGTDPSVRGFLPGGKATYE